MTFPLPSKPARMHWGTYERLRAEHDEAALHCARIAAGRRSPDRAAARVASLGVAGAQAVGAVKEAPGLTKVTFHSKTTWRQGFQNEAEIGTTSRWEATFSAG